MRPTVAIDPDGVVFGLGLSGLQDSSTAFSIRLYDMRNYDKGMLIFRGEVP